MHVQLSGSLVNQ